MKVYQYRIRVEDEVFFWVEERFKKTHWLFADEWTDWRLAIFEEKSLFFSEAEAVAEIKRRQTKRKPRPVRYINVD